MTPIEKLIELDRSAPKRLLVVGDSMLDQWVYGAISDCQDGCQKCVYEDIDPITTPGGAAGAARQLSNWHTKVFLGSIFDDGRVPVQVLGCLQRINYQQYSSPGYWLPTKRRYLDGDQIVFRADCEAPGRHYGLTQSELIGARMKVVQAVQHCQFQGVLISDYDKGFLDVETIQQIIRICRQQEIPCVADCKREPKVYEGAIKKCNDAWMEMYRDSGVSIIELVCTKGAAPPDLPVAYSYLWPSVHCLNHVGAGDAFAAHLTLALAHGLSLKEAATVAHSAGRVYVQHRHGEPPTPREIAADMHCESRAVEDQTSSVS